MKFAKFQIEVSRISSKRTVHPPQTSSISAGMTSGLPLKLHNNLTYLNLAISRHISPYLGQVWHVPCHGKSRQAF
eukprot:6213730-Pleurochrysis_carterae.AAC.6